MRSGRCSRAHWRTCRHLESIDSDQNESQNCCTDQVGLVNKTTVGLGEGRRSRCCVSIGRRGLRVAGIGASRGGSRGVSMAAASSVRRCSAAIASMCCTRLLAGPGGSMASSRSCTGFRGIASALSDSLATNSCKGSSSSLSRRLGGGTSSHSACVGACSWLDFSGLTSAGLRVAGFS